MEKLKELYALAKEYKKISIAIGVVIFIIIAKFILVLEEIQTLKFN